jgi:hypothetical protein
MLLLLNAFMVVLTCTEFLPVVEAREEKDTVVALDPTDLGTRPVA